MMLVWESPELGGGGGLANEACRPAAILHEHAKQHVSEALDDMGSSKLSCLDMALTM